MSKKVAKNPLDEKHQLPEKYSNSKKNICGHIRKAANGKIGDEEEISTELYEGFTNAKKIEKLIFDTILDKDFEYFVVRLYVVKKISDTIKEKIKDTFASWFAPAGNAHLAVQINDKIVHWIDAGMAIVLPFEGENATAVFYPQKSSGDYVPVIDNTKENREKICEIIEKYNCQETYDTKKKNCQTFAQDIFEALGLNSDFKSYEGPVGEYLNYIIRGKCGDNLVCVISKGKVAKYKGQDLSWKTHEALDEWCRVKENMEAFPQHKVLLKAFHRGFQAREKTLRKRGVEGVNDSKTCTEGMPTLLQSGEGKININLFEVESNYSFKSMSGASSGSSGDSGISSGNNN